MFWTKIFLKIENVIKRIEFNMILESDSLISYGLFKSNAIVFLKIPDTEKGQK